MSKEQAKSKTLTPKQKKFADSYIVCTNATQAAKDAGYSENCAAEQGYENLRKPHIRAYVDKRLEDHSLGKPETLKSMSDIARGSLNSYFKPKQVVRVPKFSISLSDYIERKKEEIEKAGHIHEIAKAEGLLGTGKELARHEKAYKQAIRNTRLEVVALEVELANNPDATRIIDGAPELIEVVDIDLQSLASSDNIRIKSFKMTESGPQVEICAPDAMLVNLAKIHGMLGDGARVKVTPPDPAAGPNGDRSTTVEVTLNI